MFLIPTPQLLQKIITGLDELYEHDIQDLDMQGSSIRVHAWQVGNRWTELTIPTPKHIRDLMVRLLAPTPNDKICDPACGTAGFLVSASEYIREQYEADMTSKQWDHFAGGMFSGFDTDRTMLRLSAMILMLHSITQPQIDYVDSVSKQNNMASEYDMILANPPFIGTVDAESIYDNLKTV